MAGKNEAKIRFSAETKDFDKGIKNANSTLNNLRNELKLNEAQMKVNGVSVDGLREKQQNLTAQMEAAQDKTKALSDKLAVAVDVFGENSTEAQKLRNQLVNAQTAEVKLQGAINRCNAELERQEEAASRVKTESEKLNDTISDQQSELDDLKDAYVDAVLEYGKGSREAKELAKQIDSLSEELKDNQDQMERAKKAADKLDNTVEEAGESAESASDGFTVFKGVLADLISNGIQAVIGGLNDFIGTMFNLADETLEYRTIMASLENSSALAGYTTEETAAIFGRLNGVLGDTQSAATTVANLQSIGLEQGNLMMLTNGVIGAWAKYGDSIPIDGLGEAINHTVQLGEVQGTLADVLEWGGLSVDDFNAQLAECNTTEERANLIAQMLADQGLTDAGIAWQEMNGDIVDANNAQAEYEEQTAGLAEKISPVTTALKDGWNSVLEKCNELISDVDFEGFSQTISDAFVVLTDEVIPAIIDGFNSMVEGVKEAKTWMEEHKGLVITIASVIGVLTGAIIAYNVAQGIKTAMDAAQVTTIWALVAAHWAQATAAMAAFAPYLLVVAAIAAVIAIIVLCIKYWDEIVAALKRAWEAIMATLAVWAGWINDNVIQPIAEFFTGLWSKITSACSAAWEWIKTTTSTIWNGIKNAISNVWTGITSGVSNAINKVKTTVSNVFNGIKSTAVSVWNGIKSAVVNPINAARDAVKTAIDKIKSFFKFEWSLPKLKMPHFSVSGKFSLNPLSVPKFNIDWYKDGGIMMSPTIFGLNGDKLMAGGEAGPEAILPIDRLQGYISSAIDKTMQTVNINALVAAVEDLANRPVVMNVNGRQFAVATAADTDNVSGNRLALSKRGLAL